MFAFPVGTALDVVRNNMQSQYSIFLNISKNLVNASMQLGELNAQAARKLMEESATAISKGMQVRTPADVQSFIAEQSQVTIDRVRGYALNVQNIASQNWVGPGAPLAAPVPQPAEQAQNTDYESARKAAVLSGQHESDPHPSSLVEKLVASAVSDIDKLH